MLNNTPMNFELLKVALSSRKYLNEINRTEESREQFLNDLVASKIEYPQIIELIQIAKNRQIKSLLISFVLSQKEYLDNLQGESFLTQISTNKDHTPSRLNALTHQLDIKNLSLKDIEGLQPEAAVSILCAVPLFHHITEEQVDALIRHYPERALLIYWVKHFANLPNAYYMLAHLLKCDSSYLSAELNALDEVKKQEIITSILEHLELFKPLPKLLFEGNKEQHLIRAIHFYLNGKHHEHYVAYIQRLAEHLMNKAYPLSLEAIQLLLSLNEHHVFSNLNNKTHYLMNHYLRVKANAGETELFYTKGKINILSMVQSVQLTAPQPVEEPEPEKGFFDSLLAPAKPDEPKQEKVWEKIPEHPIIKELAVRKKSVKSFDYFLMHYQGDGNKIKAVVKDYLDFHMQEGCTENRRVTLHHLSILMTRPEMPASIKEALYSAFLDYPDLYDEQISYSMLLFDTKRTLLHFGMQGGTEHYNHVINLCDEALKKLDPQKHEDTIQIVTQAQAEAKKELGFYEEKGFFARIFERFIRCWVYGWTGFFAPNLPVYVCPSYEVKPVTSIPPFPEGEPAQGDSVKANLSSLLLELETQYSEPKRDELIKILSTFSFSTNSRDELVIRHKINRLFQELRSNGKQNSEMNEWLIKNKSVFIANQFKLVEMVLLKDNQNELDSLIKQIDEDSTFLHSVANELNRDYPEFKEKIVPAGEKSHAILPADVMGNATVLVNDAWEWTKNGVWGLFAGTQVPQSTPTIAEPAIPAESAQTTPPV
ncbi:hypothetical protein [Legionella shakespearei]|uniref:Dot/Icm T4SS effector n=1 Tax=Legionella shakespearei DSM 23087 TaxID=1122169 RepID=A0A0W0YW41_9GAMM|nr:hypothetical protein [Legionella shakespearei]KTD61064.1 Dot/Icm T4SS effector [Legionella shakespearei DSM 23087]